jgi:hypothetical protein
MTESRKLVKGMRLVGKRGDKMENAFYAVVSEGSDRCLDAVVSIMGQNQQYDGRHRLAKLLVHLEHVDLIRVEYCL